MPLVTSCESVMIPPVRRDGKSPNHKCSKRSDYGLKFNAPLETGGVMLSDDVQVHLDIELIKKT